MNVIAAQPSTPLQRDVGRSENRTRYRTTTAAVAAKLCRKSITVGRQYLLTLHLPGMDDRGFKAKVEPSLGDALAVGDEVWVELPLERITLFDPDGHRVDASMTASRDVRPESSPVTAAPA